MMQKPAQPETFYKTMKLAILLPHGITIKEHTPQIKQFMKMYVAAITGTYIAQQVQVKVLQQGEIAPSDADAILQLPMRAFVKLMENKHVDEI